MKCRVVVALILVAAAGSSRAQICADYSTYTHFSSRLSLPPDDGTVIQAIQVSGGYAYAGGTPDTYLKPYLYVIDLSSPLDPEVVGSLTGAFVSGFDLEVRDTLVYVASQTTNELIVVSVSDPANPVALGAVSTWRDAYAVSVSGDYAFVATYDSGLVAVDVSTPSAPVVTDVLNFDPGQDAVNVVVDHPYAYVGLVSPNAFKVVDVSDPYNLSEEATLPVVARALDVAGGYAYVGPILRVIDISNPLAPSEMGSVGGYGFYGLVVDGPTVYASRSGIFSTSGVLATFDVSDPANPEFLMQTDMAAGAGPRPIAVDGDLVYTGAGAVFGEVLGVEVGTAGDMGTYDGHVGSVAGFGLVGAMRMRGTLGYVGTWTDQVAVRNKLNLYDISSAPTPALLGTVDLTSIGSAEAVDGDGSHAFVAFSGEIYAVDVSSPPALVVLDTFATGYGIQDAWLDGTYLYIAAVSSGLHVIDVASPGTMAEIGSSGSGTYHQVIVRDGYAFVASSSGLEVLDISDPTMPGVVATVPVEYTGHNVVLDGDYAFVTYGVSLARRMAVVDITNPLAPSTVGDIGIPADGQDIAVLDGIVYVASHSLGICAIDASDPPNAQPLGDLYPGATFITELEAGNGYIFANCAGGGNCTDPLNIYLPQCAPVGSATGETPALSTRLRAFPNPFNPEVAIEFNLPFAQLVAVEVYDVIGRRIAIVASGRMPAGPNRVHWTGHDANGLAVASGVYFARLTTPSGVQTAKLTLLK